MKYASGSNRVASEPNRSESRDQVAGAFGHVELNGNIELNEAISILDRKRMRNQTVLAKEVPAYASPKRF